MITFKNKRTGRIYTQIGTSAGSGGCFFILATEPGPEELSPVVRVPYREVFADYEIISNKIDYSKVLPQILNSLQMDSRLNDLFNAYLRRNTKDYYVPGKYVFVLFSFGLGPEILHSVDDCIFIIKRIDTSINGNLTLVLGKTMDSEKEYKFSMRPDIIEDHDAFSCVKRIDYPY